MSELKSNYPHPDRCVTGSHAIPKPSTNGASGITWSKDNLQHTQHRPCVGVKLGLGTAPMKMNRASTNRMFNNAVTFQPKRGQFNG